MIDNLEFVVRDGILLRYTIDDKPEEIPVSAVEEQWILIDLQSMEYWSELTTDTFEYGSATVFDEKYIVLTISIAEGQSGGVFVWNAQTHEIVHVSNGDYAIAATMNDENVYAIHYIHHYGISPHFEISHAPFHTMDIRSYKKFDCEIPFRVDEIDDIQSITMDMEDGKIVIHTDAGEYEIEI